MQYNKTVHIGENVWIGAGTIIVPGVTIGKNSVIGAGSVVVKKDIQADYSINAEGNVIVNGNVEKAFITADGDITVKGACFGKGEGIIKSKNDVLMNFIESTKVEAEGNIIVNEGIMNCEVTAGKKILVVDRKGTIVGGN